MFYDMPILISILRVSSIGIIFNSLCVVQRARLLIIINFKAMAKENISCAFIGGFIGVWMAYNGWGGVVDSFQLAQQSVTVCLYWFLGKWMPTCKFSNESFYNLYRFGVKLLAAGCLATISREIYSVVIGKVYNSTELRYYSNSARLTDTISGTVNEVINLVSFPILTSFQHKRERLVTAYSRMLSMTSFLIFPVKTLTALLTPPLVKTILTERWLMAIPLILWLCFARIFTPISGLKYEYIECNWSVRLVLESRSYKISHFIHHNGNYIT